MEQKGDAAGRAKAAVGETNAIGGGDVLGLGRLKGRHSAKCLNVCLV